MAQVGAWGTVTARACLHSVFACIHICMHVHVYAFVGGWVLRSRSGHEILPTHRWGFEQCKCGCMVLSWPPWHCTLLASLTVSPDWASSPPWVPKVRLSRTCVSRLPAGKIPSHSCFQILRECLWERVRERECVCMRVHVCMPVCACLSASIIFFSFFFFSPSFFVSLAPIPHLCLPPSLYFFDLLFPFSLPLFLLSLTLYLSVNVVESVCACMCWMHGVCVCVCERERERERGCVCVWVSERASEGVSVRVRARRVMEYMLSSDLYG